MSVLADVSRFRAQYREEEIPRGYQGWMHATFTFGFGGAVLIAGLWQVKEVQPMEWLTIPIAFLYANLAEYFGHRFPMHHPWPGLGLIYRRHAKQHHRFYTHEAMELEEQRDFRATLFPPLLVIFFFGGFGVPMWLVLNWLATPNVAWLAVSVGVAYYLNYELLHFSYHAREGTWLARNPVVRRLRALHQTHHDQARMARCNFNITYPIGDWLFRTFER